MSAHSANHHLTAEIEIAIEAAKSAGELLRENFGKRLDVNEYSAHDIKLELDVRAQDIITEKLLTRFPDHALYGEEGIAGNQASEFQWIVDPIDGTVNYFYGLPHFCISIALRNAGEIILGVIYDPMRDELWQVAKNEAPLLNGREIAVSERAKLSDCILTVGFSKTQDSIDSGMPVFEKMVNRARKCRMMGSAALDMAYIAAGRLDAYIEKSVNLWDIAAGKLLVEAAGGRVEITHHKDNPDKLSIIASNGKVDLNV